MNIQEGNRSLVCAPQPAARPPWLQSCLPEPRLLTYPAAARAPTVRIVCSARQGIFQAQDVLLGGRGAAGGLRDSCHVGLFSPEIQTDCSVAGTGQLENAGLRAQAPMFESWNLGPQR